MHQNNIVKFKPERDLISELDLQLDKGTLQRIDEIAAQDGKTRDEVIQEACDVMLADYAIGDRLLAYLQLLRKNPARKKVRFDPIKIWERRIVRIMDRLGANNEPADHPPGKAA